MSSSLEAFLNPRGVAVVGASTLPEKLGYGVARNLAASGYRGAIHFVGQKHAELFGHPLLAALSEVPDPVDLAVLVVPNTSMPEAIRACAARGIHAAIIVSAGFREAGPEGAALERECAALGRELNVRLLGPNCIGTLDTHLPLDTTFLQPPMPRPGGIAFASHSGAFAAAIVDWSRREGFSFSQIVSLGNQADVNETEILPLLAADEHTRVITLYMEGVSDGVRFVEVCARLSTQKPLIALKAGRSTGGKKAAASHTGALAGSDRAFEAAFAKAGVLRADTAEQMFDWARALEACPLPRGNRIAVLTNAGGPGVMAADALEANGLRLAALGLPTEQALSARLPRAAGIHNPVDMLASASPSDYAECLSVLLAEAEVEAAMVILPPPPMYSTVSVAEAVIPIIRASAKPVVVALLGSELTAAARERFEAERVVTYPFPERAASALGVLARRAASLQAGTSTAHPTLPADNTAREPFPPDFSPEQALAAYQIEVVGLKLARSQAEVLELAPQIGYPQVMKISSPDIPHKSDVGGVLVNIGTLEEALLGYTHLLARARTARPEARMEGVSLQRQIEAGQDVILGMVRDPLFGPLLMFGAGGVEAEGLQDVAFALGPLDADEADELIGRTWAGKKLRGFRSIAPVDVPAVRAALVSLSSLSAQHPEVREIEINPLRVLAHGALALDVRWQRS